MPKSYGPLGLRINWKNSVPGHVLSFGSVKKFWWVSNKKCKVTWIWISCHLFVQIGRLYIGELVQSSNT